jgi:methyltransferase (TIGR00027 family)
METGQPSRTLLGPAIRRAAHQLLDAPLILEDPVAVGLVPEARADSIRAGLAEHQTQESILLRSLFVLRSRFAEDRLAEAAARGVRQYLILGAGLDTFAWRQPNYARDMRIFLADHVSSLVWTQEKFWERGLPKPGNLTFVPLDIEDGRLGERLSEFGFLAQPAFCSALGVTQYLELASVEVLLRFVASLGRGSEIVFSYVPRAEDLDGADRDFAEASAARAGRFGEPWKTRFGADELRELLRAAGFHEVSHLTPEHARQRYFAGRTDGLRPASWEQLIAAVV